jgi:hydrogenase nickel incorporation protein HypA/HybF
MHELAVTENIVSIAIAKATEVQAQRIIQINIVIGELSGFVPDCIQFYFDSLSRETIAQEATLHFQTLPAQLRCRDCATVFSPHNGAWLCPQCQRHRVEVVQGREFYVESIEVE